MTYSTAYKLICYILTQCIVIGVKPVYSGKNPLHPIAAKYAREISNPIAVKCARASLSLFIVIAGQEVNRGKINHGVL